VVGSAHALTWLASCEPGRSSSRHETGLRFRYIFYVLRWRLQIKPDDAFGQQMLFNLQVPPPNCCTRIAQSVWADSPLRCAASETHGQVHPSAFPGIPGTRALKKNAK